MQLTPRYDGRPLFEIDGAFDDVLVPLARQRRRLAAVLATLEPDEWEQPSRCEDWRVRDVVAHLVTVNQFFQLSIAAGLAGEPTRFMTTFDPVATPAALVEAMAGQMTSDLLDALVASNDGFLDPLAALDEAGWTALAESPPGHVSVRLACFHALWDCWVHERDILLPLGRRPEVEADEVDVCLRYAAALSPAFAVATGAAHPGMLAVAGHGPDSTFTVEVGDPVVVRAGGASDADAICLEGDSVELIDALTLRAPLPNSAPEEWARLLRGGLAVVFDAEPGAPTSIG